MDNIAFHYKLQKQWGMSLENPGKMKIQILKLGFLTIFWSFL